MTSGPVRWLAGWLAAAAALALVAACTSTPPPPDHLTLTPVGFEALPGWTDDPLSEALPALRLSCQRLTELPAEQPIGANGGGGLAEDWLGPCGALRAIGEGPGEVRTYFETWFQPYLAANGDKAEGRFTGYYEPEFNGSRQAGPGYRVPLYTRPDDLPSPAQGAAGAYYSRAEIEAGALAGKVPELLWLADPVDAHVLQIQGSGRIRLDDGSVVRVGYNGSNGRKYVALGRILVDHGILSLGEATMPRVVAWLKAHPGEAPALMVENPRYVFFRLIDGDAPIGAAGVPLTVGRSLAVDPRFVPLGVPLWVDTRDPDGVPLRRLMVAQDSGAAITGPVRGDVFWGAGEQAFDQAGRMNSRGSYYLLLPRRRSGLVAGARMGAFGLTRETAIIR
jgi:membrane-bound lytic murein transglycosylase A